jgi:DNA-binding response OmpR family regulator
MILIIDNDPAFQKSLATWLSLEGFAVRTANDGVTGLKLIQKERPDAVICDVNSPNLSGLEVLKALRQNSSIADTAFLLMTATRDDSIRWHAQQLDANAFLEKGRMWTQLSLTLKACLSSKLRFKDKVG